jgi:nitrile hydratase subunit beta
MTLAAGACARWNIDKSRHARETLHPVAYLSKSYYEIWIEGLEKLLVTAGLVTPEELRCGRCIEPPAAVAHVLKASEVDAALRQGRPYSREPRSLPRFSIGQSVLTKVINPTTHTRLPRYARGKRGTIDHVRGCFVFPDSNAHDAGEDPQWCYGVRFAGRELWGAAAEPLLGVTIDAFEPYLVPV